MQIKNQLIDKDKVLQHTLSIIKGKAEKSSTNILYINSCTESSFEDIRTKIRQHVRSYNLEPDKILKVCIDAKIIHNSYMNCNTDTGRTWNRVRTLDKRPKKKYETAIIHPTIKSMLSTLLQMFPKLQEATGLQREKTIVIIDFSTSAYEIETIKSNITNSIKESYINEQMPQLFRKLIVLNPILLNKMVLKLFNESKETFHCQHCILAFNLEINQKRVMEYNDILRNAYDLAIILVLIMSNNVTKILTGDQLFTVVQTGLINVNYDFGTFY